MNPRRIRLIQSPTPLHRLDRVSEDLGIDLWIKRDDLTGFALGGNKGRKLEYIMPEIVDGGYQAVVTCGAMQSNFIRQLGAACSMFGIRCVAAVMPLPYNAADGFPMAGGLAKSGGNVLLDGLFGVELHEMPNDDWEVLYAKAEQIADGLEAEGIKTYRVPVGGSSPLGGYAFFEAAQELEAQAAPFDFLLTSTSSGSTQAGLGYAFAGSSTKVIGVQADPEEEFVEDVLRVGAGLCELLGREELGAQHFDVRIDWAGDAYGVPSPEGNSAIEYLAKREGILFDPIYTGKAFAGLLALAGRGEIKGRVLFWHTGGIPALFCQTPVAETG